MDEKTHYGELLVQLRNTLDKYEHYKDDPNVITGKNLRTTLPTVGFL